MTLFFKIISLASSLFLIAVMALAEEPVYPVKVSPNGRYFVNQQGRPVFWLGATQWQLFREYTVEDAKLIIQKSKNHGFAFIQVMLMGVGDGNFPMANARNIVANMHFLPLAWVPGSLYL